ncbi:MAG: hypothetical protein AB4042_21720 [Leptolyngbyaceae cyanobacterium]
MGFQAVKPSPSDRPDLEKKTRSPPGNEGCSVGVGWRAIAFVVLSQLPHLG